MSLDPDGLLARFSHTKIAVPKPQVMAIDLMSPEGAATVRVPERSELVVMYAGRFVLEGKVHPAGNMPVLNLLNVMGGLYFPMSQARLHPVAPTRELPMDFSHMLIFNRNFVDFFHPQAPRW